MSPPNFTGEGLIEELATSENILCRKKVSTSVNPAGTFGVDVEKLGQSTLKPPSAKFELSPQMSD